MSQPLSQINRVDRCINSAQWRMFCGDPSNESWARYRSIVGIGRRRTLTPYEALMVWALRHWTTVLGDLSETYHGLPADILAAESTVNRWLMAGHQSFNADSIGTLAGLNAVQARDLPQLLAIVLGKHRSERSLYRICRCPGIPQYSRRKTYSKSQVQAIASAIAAS